MCEDRIQRAIEFLTQSMADFAARNAIMEENFKVMQSNFITIQKDFVTIQKDSITIRKDSIAIQENVKSLALLTRDLVTVAQMHSQRLDRLEGLG